MPRYRRVEALDAPVAAFWLQTGGQRKTLRHPAVVELGLTWTTTPTEFAARDLQTKNISSDYINPFLCDDVVRKRDHRRNLFEEAEGADTCEEPEGMPYRIRISSSRRPC